MPRVRTKSPAHQTPTPTPRSEPAPLEANSLALAMIQALIPLGLQAVEDALQQEVLALAGPRYAHADGRPGIARWGAQAGSVFLADQKLPIQVPRVRDRATNTEVPLATYAQLQTPRGQDVGLFRRVLGGLSCRDYEAAAEAVPEAFGLTKSSVSRRFVRASAKALQTLHERRHDDAEWLVLLLDGKAFADDQVVIALGVTTTGEKRLLGLVQTATENKRVCAAFLRELVERGFQAPAGLLVVLDGAKGLSAAVRDVFGERVPIQRCQWHKRENVLSYLPKTQHALWRRKLQTAYAKSTYADAQHALWRLVKDLKQQNASAARSLEEGLEETLTLHRLEVFAKLGISFKTTNLIESVMARVEAKTHRITRWRTSDQKQRWCAATLLDIEKQFRKVKGYQHLGLLQAALRGKLSSPLDAA
ncbi:MAG: IS256 family transposase [Gemmatimonas sp.]|nr:IS256 family transposase [Gemmatimonas sp.]MCO4098223.1 IS256 family transposase [Gemmatimonas sp.]MCO4098735.1 IS256 family transposase [Gemmatimonas sp.]MCO4098886.1 IS256 family transposase [Gemmatimonas sp.]